LNQSKIKSQRHAIKAERPPPPAQLSSSSSGVVAGIEDGAVLSSWLGAKLVVLSDKTTGAALGAALGRGDDKNDGATLGMAVTGTGMVGTMASTMLSIAAVKPPAAGQIIAEPSVTSIVPSPSQSNPPGPATAPVAVAISAMAARTVGAFVDACFPFRSSRFRAQ
jgi:hypothetical protein